MRIIWTHLAKNSYREILTYLDSVWTKKELKKFNDLTNQVIDKIHTQQITFPLVEEDLSIRKAVIHKNVSLFYTEDLKNNETYLLTFFDNRMNPKTLQKLLKKES